ncbi:alcohol dehydrogenase GroES-like domain-containing protein [Colletotrichum graminicola]|uniref:Alcohol dehydrogenase GroES-like domain-containing protein n=1 Tax=Colletotrichum graminicola (strain M1.001 / M2 / FGSC 10212) TaxID=645133 RepID=E3QPQ5_COLGM|nr:alcohol dehydrogenase GroES-like domain-containing protein [Colletotrichum graminicola M1.001]EFQ32832.1 alcohol dehydrogenase GroES-like domain-containing protein [Colletotrichum graminicola M1.001]WDK16478.1 alcohol dehydrogenase GroES-like domain-containing protein [Colletotrichum graminicola]
MLAFQYESPKEGLKLCRIPIPEPGPGSVQIRVKAAGLCHSDCHVINGHDGMLVKKPITLGHEASGIITAIGANVVEYRPGDRVAVSLLAYPLNMDVRGWAMAIGFGFDGGYAEYVVAPVIRLVRIPDGVPFSQAAVATDAMATAYHAVVVEAGVYPGATIGVVGIGGLGMQGLRFAALKGATVYGIDIVDSKFARAKQFGARGCFKTLKEAGDIAFDIIVDFVGAKETTRLALERVKEGGKVVLVGLAAGNVTISSTDLVARSITLVGSLGASEADLKNVLELLSKKEIEPHMEEIPFADIPAGLNALGMGKVQGRLWTDPSKLRKRSSQL